MVNGQKIYMIADDFTGSADAANYFCSGGREVRVSFDLHQPWDFTLGENVVQVIDTESRGIATDVAMKRVYEVGLQINRDSKTFISLYKKVDSTMRGHVGAEIEALLKSTGRHVALLALSFPSNGRIVLHGNLFINGCPISQTAFARDPHSPIDRDDVAGIVQQTTSLPVVLMDQSVIRGGATSIKRYLDRVDEPYVVIVADAQTDEDLLIIAQAIAYDNRILPCGSAGLARQLATIWCEQDRKDNITNSTTQLPNCKQVVIAVGSANPVTSNQLSYVLSRYKLSAIAMSPRRLGDVLTHNLEMERGLRDIEGLDTDILAVCLSNERASREDDIAGSFEGDLAAVIQCYLEKLSRGGNTSIGLVATGGDTAFALCQAMKAKAFWPQGELIPGMPWSLLETDCGVFPIVSKAGGFGAMDALYVAVAAMTGRNS